MAAEQQALPTLDVLAKREPQSLGSPNPMTLLQMALSQNLDTERLSKFMDLAERWERNEAKKAYTEAMIAFKGECIVVVKDKVNQQYGSKYSSLESMVNTVIPYLSRHNLSHGWDIDQSSGIRVSCIITHVMGHSETVALSVPPDTSGAKNPIQQIKSAITYAKACTFESICGLASRDTSLNDDGNAAGKASKNGGALDNLSEHIEWIKNSRNEQELDRLFKAAYQAASKANDSNAQKAIVHAKDTRRKELQ